MAYYDVLSADSYGRFNRKLAKLTNLQTAVYWSEILDIITKVVKKKKFDDQGYFKLDRKYVEERTSINLDSQFECDSVLEKLAVLQRHEADPNLIKVELATMEQILITDDVKQLDLPKNIVKRTATQKVADKKAAILMMLKNHIKETDSELQTAYKNWIDVTYDKGMCKTAQVQLFIDTINKFTADKNVKLKLINIAISLSYKVADWAINKYTADNHLALGVQKTSTGVSSKFEF